MGRLGRISLGHPSPGLGSTRINLNDPLVLLCYNMTGQQGTLYLFSLRQEDSSNAKKTYEHFTLICRFYRLSLVGTFHAHLRTLCATERRRNDIVFPALAGLCRLCPGLTVDAPTQKTAPRLIVV